ncbi:MAG: sigma-70 family RNA polymerase sigma factor [Kiritimatiellae bacterium]|nr:sigma-70 family RNA polymerase sigma factor [Kiritimatiellia bacterium]
MTDNSREIETIVTEHEGFVKALALKLAPAPGMCDDIAQQVFLEFMAKADQFDLSRDVKPLLAMFTRNVAMRCWRERQKVMSPEMRKLADHIRMLAEEKDFTWYSDAERTALRRCLDKLPEKSRHILQVHYYLGVSSVEIAGKMHMKAAAVRRALFRLRKELRRCIERTLAGESYA